MGLNDDVARYTKLSGTDGNYTPIGIIGTYLEGYDKGCSTSTTDGDMICRREIEKETGLNMTRGGNDGRRKVLHNHRQ